MNYPKALRLALFGLLATTASVSAGAEAEVPKSKSQEWSVRTYQIPPNTLASPPTFLTEPYSAAEKDPFERAAPAPTSADYLGIDPTELRLKIPPPEAPEADQINFIKQSTAVLLRGISPLKTTVPEGSLFAYDASSWTLAVRTSPAYHELLQRFEILTARIEPLNIGFRLDIFSADAVALRALVSAAATRTNHNSILADLEMLVTQGQAQRITTLKIDTKNGYGFHLSSGPESREVTGFSMDGEFRPTYSEALIKSGVDLELYPLLNENRTSMDVRYTFSYDYAPARKDWSTIPAVGQRPLVTPVFHHRKVFSRSSLSMEQDIARLLCAWSPDESISEPKTLQAAFLRPSIMRPKRAKNLEMEHILKRWAEQIFPAPKVALDNVPASVPPGMKTKRYRIPSYLLSFGAPLLTLGNESLKQSCISQGVEFPPGATLDYSIETEELVVQNTPENLRQFELIATFPEPGLRALSTTLQIIQADGEFIRQLERDTSIISDHRAAWKAVEAAAAQGKVQFLSTAQLIGKSGQRAKFETGEWRMNVRLPSPHARKFETDKEEKEQLANPVERTASKHQQGVYQTDLIGTSLEIDPYVAEDGETIDLALALSYDYAPPTESVPPPLDPKNAIRLDPSSPTLHRFTMNTSLSLLSGQPRLLSIWKPECKPAETPPGKSADVLQAAFIHVDVMKLEPTER